MPTGVLAFVEYDASGLRKSAFEIVFAGRELAEKLGGPLSAVVVGEDPSGAAPALTGLGVAKVHTVADAALARMTADGFGTALAAVAAEADPAVVLMAASMTGKDAGPALAARLSCGIISDVVGFDVADGKLAAVRPVYGGKVRATVEPAGWPVVMTLRPNVFPPAEGADGSGEVGAVTVDVAGALRAVIKEVREPEERKVDLTEADIVVAGGRGMKDAENFHLVEALADALGGVVGASRAVVDAGWRPHAEQVGQTGKTVSPKLYVACGISGAIQHLAGMSSSKCIVAVNKDPEAPIFKVADYGVVGDVMEVLPVLTEKIQTAKSS
ncbi:MAG: electron transfer flavoprotein subunit alpha/FixB family protein [Planctomycetota bacterium]